MKQSAPPPSSGTCLVVDDDDDITQVLTYHLARRGFATTVATTLTDARDRLSRQPWDLVVVDVMLPDGDGRELIGVVHGLTHRSKVVLTSVLSRYDLPDHDADAYLAKPFRAAEVSHAISAAGLAHRL